MTKSPKVSLTKCEDGRGNKTKNSLMSTNLLLHNANNLQSVVDSDSEYETEEVYELREWYPPDFWKSNHFVDKLTSNLNHLRNKAEEGKEGNNNNNNNNNKKKVCLTDVTVDDLTITMMESQTEKGFFKTL